MTWTIHPRTIARQRRQQRLLDTLQAQPEGRATIPALRAACGLAETPWTFSDDVTALVKAGHVIRDRDRPAEGQRRGVDIVIATWLPCNGCNEFGDLDVIRDGEVVGVEPCADCDATGRQGGRQ